MESAVWTDLSRQEVLELTGEERVSFLNAYNTQDISNLPARGGALGAVLTQKGKIVSETWILGLPEKILLIVEPGGAQKILEHWKTFLLFAKAELTERSQDWTHWGIFGPRAEALLAQGFGGKEPEKSSATSVREVNGSPVYLWASDRFGIAGWELLAPAALRPTLVARLQEAGSVLGGCEIEPSVLDIFRVEAGYPKMGVDMSEDNLVAEVGLDKRATSFNKGCYLGQETTARVNSQGHVNRSLYRFKLPRPYSGSLPAEIFSGEKAVGSLTSLVDSPRFGGPLGLGLAHRAAFEGDKGIWIQDSQGKIELKTV
jgi:folate-binding protein YgfZ